MDESNQSSISQATSYQEIGEFWDAHDVTEFWDQTHPVEFDIDIRSETTLCAIEAELAIEISRIAHQRGVSRETLINLWIRDRLTEEKARLIPVA